MMMIPTIIPILVTLKLTLDSAKKIRTQLAMYYFTTEAWKMYCLIANHLTSDGPQRIQEQTLRNRKDGAGEHPNTKHATLDRLQQPPNQTQRTETQPHNNQNKKHPRAHLKTTIQSPQPLLQVYVSPQQPKDWGLIIFQNSSPILPAPTNLCYDKCHWESTTFNRRNNWPQF